MIAPLKTDAEKADAIARDAADLAAQLRRTNGEYNQRAYFRLLELCNSVIALVDDGDCMTCREHTMFELGCDEDGNPAPSESDLVRFPTGRALSEALNHSVPQ